MKNHLFLGKKLVILFFLAFVIIFALTISARYVPSITVLYPNGGETLQIDNTYTIQWSSSDILGNVVVKLIKGTQTLGSRNVANTGSVSWTVPNVPTGSDYKVRIESEDGSVFDESDGNFTIKAQETRSLTVLYPNGGETWEVGNSYTIRWSSSEISGNVVVKLIKGTQTLGSRNVANTGSVSWTVPNVPAGSDYKIRIESEDGSVFDESDGNFTIKAQETRSLTVLYPNGGETWEVGNSYTIRWSSSEISGNVVLKLIKGTQTLGSRNVANTGSVSWTVPNVPAGSDYKVRIESEDSSVFDESDNYIKIAEPPPPEESKIKVTSPNGGEILTLGEIKGITWEFEPVSASKVNIALLQGTRVIGRIARDVPLGYNGRGLYRWQVGKHGGGTALPGDRYKVRVRTTDNAHEDLSDRSFTIKKKIIPEYRIPPKILSFRINNGAESTPSSTVTLNNRAQFSPKEYRVQYRRKSGWVWTDWKPYNIAPTFETARVCGPVTLNLQLRNGFGESSLASDSIEILTDKNFTEPGKNFGCQQAGSWHRIVDAGSQWTFFNVTREDPGTVTGISCSEVPLKIYIVRGPPAPTISHGAKADIELLAGVLEPGWSFVSYKYEGLSGHYKILRKPSPGSRDIRLKFRLWLDAGFSPREAWFRLHSITIKGPCNEHISRAFGFQMIQEPLPDLVKLFQPKNLLSFLMKPRTVSPD